MAENNNARAGSLPEAPHRKLRTLDRLIGRWRTSGTDIEGVHSYACHDEESDELVVRQKGTDGSRFHYADQGTGVTGYDFVMERIP